MYAASVLHISRPRRTGERTTRVNLLNLLRPIFKLVLKLLFHFSMADLLEKFRINYSDLVVFPDLTDLPQASTQAWFDTLIHNFTQSTASSNKRVTYSNNLHHLMDRCDLSDGRQISEAELAAHSHKTHRHIRLRELLLEHSSNSSLVVM